MSYCDPRTMRPVPFNQKIDVPCFNIQFLPHFPFHRGKAVVHFWPAGWYYGGNPFHEKIPVPEHYINRFSMEWWGHGGYPTIKGDVFNMFTWKCASRHNGLHFFDIATSKSGLRP